MIHAFFTAATSYDGKLHNQYERIVDLLEKQKVSIVSGKQVADSQLLKKDEELERKEIFKRESESINNADCVIAEVSMPSLGVGGEIVYALTKKKPVLALVHESFADKLSPMITGNPSEYLFLEYYNEDNLSFVLKHFMEYITTSKNRKGKLIVIDGGDGSGKETQVNLLTSMLTKEKKPYKVIDFPRYYTSFHGKTVAQFMRGEFGRLDEVSPYLASLAYALDRASMKEEVELALEKGDLVIANRYATSSLAHQGAKFNNKEERTKFLKWLYELEYNVHRIPKENLVIYLYVPWRIGLELTNKKETRAYLKGKDDIAEKDIHHRKTTEEMYLEFAKKNKHWVTVECVKNGKLLSKQEIHEKIIDILKQKGFI